MPCVGKNIVELLMLVILNPFATICLNRMQSFIITKKSSSNLQEFRFTVY